MSLIWPSISSFWASQRFWEIVEYVGEGVVIVCALAEALAEFRGIPKDRKKRKRVIRMAAVGLIVGLAIELLGLFRASSIADAATALLANETERIRTENIALQAKVNLEVQKRTQLQVDFSVRVLRDDLKPYLVRDFGKFRKGAVTVAYIRDNVESYELGEQILSSVIGAKLFDLNVDPPTTWKQRPVSSPGIEPIIGFAIIAGNKVPEDNLKQLAFDLGIAGALGTGWGEQKRYFPSGNDDDNMVVIAGLNPSAGPMPLGFWERMDAITKGATTSPSMVPTSSPR